MNKKRLAEIKYAGVLAYFTQGQHILKPPPELSDKSV